MICYIHCIGLYNVIIFQSEKAYKALQLMFLYLYNIMSAARLNFRPSPLYNIHKRQSYVVL